MRIDRPILNLHNHTPFSDGAYTIDEIVEAHLDLKEIKVTGIGISDMLFCTPSSHPVANPRDFQRVFAAETRRYVQTVREAQQRWAGRMRILCGCEIHWALNKPHLEVMRGMLDGIDYVLFESLDWSGLTGLANQARRWPCAVGLADSDPAADFPSTTFDQVVRTIANARIFYEIGAKLMPLEQMDSWFRVLPKHKVFVSFGTDTHDDLSVISTLPALYQHACDQGLGDKLFLPAVMREPASASA